MRNRGLSFFLRAACAWVMILPCPAQNEYTLIKPNLPALLRPYAPPTVPTFRSSNSRRIHDLMRAGKIYLSVQDALSLAIENNLDLEVDRYGPLLAQSALERALAGGPIRGVPSASAQVSSVDSGLGVNGSVQSAGLSNNTGSGNGGGNGAAVIQQVGAVTPNLDPVLQNTSLFEHLSQPQSTPVVSQTTNLIQTIHVYNTTLQEGFLTGGYIQYRDYEQYLKENSPTDVLNPAVGPHMDFALRHNLLQGFGIRLNDRFIRIARINKDAALANFRSQLLDLTASVLHLYWNLVNANDELKIRRDAAATAEKFYQDTQTEINAGAMPRVQLPRAQSEAASRRQDVTVAEFAVKQQEALLKDAIVRAPDPEVEAAEIVTLDPIEIPPSEDLPPLRQLVADAMQNRPDVAVTRFRDQTAQLSLLGTENPLLPSLQIQAQAYDRGAAGTPVPGNGANPYFVGGYGTALKQILRRDFPNESGSLSFNPLLFNRRAQGDYGIDQLQFRQSQVSDQSATNQIVVNISNQVSALRQSRSRYSAAKDTRALQEQLLADDRKKFSYGLSAFNDLIVDQRALTTAQISELTALVTYAHARVSLDQVLGRTLEQNHISLEESLSGTLSAPSKLP